MQIGTVGTWETKPISAYKKTLMRTTALSETLVTLSRDNKNTVTSHLPNNVDLL